MSMTGHNQGAAHNGGGADLIKDSTDASFVADVIEASKTVPVIVDFWAPWCGPCRQLGPAIERVVAAAKGAVRLVKINIDENPAIAGQLRVQSIPAVFGFKDGQPVDGFAGAQPESQIKAFVERLSGTRDPRDDAQKLVDMGNESLKIGDMGGAAQGFAQALQLIPDYAPALAGMARCYMQNDDVEGAKGLLATVREEDRAHPDIVGVQAALDLAAAGTLEDQESAQLQSTIAANPDDLQARYDLAQALSAGGDLEGAMDQLLEIIARDKDWNDGAARALLLKTFDAAGAGSPLSVAGRRRLSSLLFS